MPIYQPTVPWTQYYGQINAIAAEWFANLKNATQHGTERNTLQKVYGLAFVVPKEINLKIF